jgi:hypothetical protein
MLKSMSYKSLKDTQLKITPTCFGSQRIHHQGVITCTLTEITCSGSQIFIVCMVGVWRHRWILCDPKHVGVIFNYVSFKLLYDIDFNIYVLYN